MPKGDASGRFFEMLLEAVARPEPSGGHGCRAYGLRRQATQVRWRAGSLGVAIPISEERRSNFSALRNAEP